MLRGEHEFQACWPMVTDCLTSSLRPHCSSVYLRHSGGQLPFYYYNYLQQQQQIRQLPRAPVTHQLKSAEALPASLSTIFMHTASSTPPIMALEEVVDRNKNSLLMLPPPMSRSPDCSDCSSDVTDHLSSRLTASVTTASPNPVTSRVTSRSSSLSSPPPTSPTLSVSHAEVKNGQMSPSPLPPPPPPSTNHPCSSPVSPAMALFPRRPDSTSSASSTASTASSSLDSSALHRHYQLQSSSAVASMAILQHQHPFEQRPPAVNNNNDVNNVLEGDNNRTLKFSIENILRPDFGRVALGSGSHQESTVSSSNRKRHHHHHHHHHSRNKVTTTTPNNKTNVKATSTTTANQAAANDAAEAATATKKSTSESNDKSQQMLWPAWVYCTRYSDRPSSGRSPRSRRIKKKDKKPEEKRPRTAFTNEQLARLKKEFQENRYLTEKRRQDLAKDLQLNESQIKIWFQNKRAKIKKASGQRNGLALHLMAQGLYNHSTVHNNQPGSPHSAKDDDKDKGDMDDDMDDDDDDEPLDIDMDS